MHRLLVVEKIVSCVPFDVEFTPLSRSYLLHRSVKLKPSYVESSLLFSQMNFQEFGIDPFFSDGTVEKVSSNTT